MTFDDIVYKISTYLIIVGTIIQVIDIFIRWYKQGPRRPKHPKEDEPKTAMHRKNKPRKQPIIIPPNDV